MCLRELAPLCRNGNNRLIEVNSLFNHYLQKSCSYSSDKDAESFGGVSAATSYSWKVGMPNDSEPEKEPKVCSRFHTQQHVGLCQVGLRGIPI